MPSKKVTIIGLILLAFAGILAAFFLGLNTLLREPRIHGFILGQISEVTGYVFRAGRLELGLKGGLGITARDVEVSSKDRPETLAVSTVKISLELRELLRAKFIPSRLHLAGFRLDLGDYRALLRPSETPLPQIPFHRLLLFPLIQGEDVEISFQQDPLRLRHVNFEIVREGLTPSALNIRAGGIMLYQTHGFPFSLSGTLMEDPQQKGRMLLDLGMEAQSVPLSPLPWPGFLPFARGSADVHLKISGDPAGPLSFRSSLFFRDISFALVRKTSKKVFPFPWLCMDLFGLFSKKTITVDSFQMQGPSFNLRGESALDLVNLSDPRLYLRVEAPDMPVEIFKGIFPSALLPPPIQEELLPSIKTGRVKVLGFGLDGTIHQIDTLSEPKNSSALSLYLDFKALKIERAGHALKDVSGQFRIHEGHLSVSVSHAGFGISKIQEGTLSVPGLYGPSPAVHFSLHGDFDLQDLLDQARKEGTPTDIRQALPPIQDLKGRLSATLRGRYEKGGGYPEIIQGTFHLTDCSLQSRPLLLPLHVHKAQFRLEEGDQVSGEAQGMWGRSPFHLQGNVNRRDRGGRVDISGDPDLQEVLSLFFPDRALPVALGPAKKSHLVISKAKETWILNGEVPLAGVFFENQDLLISPPNMHGGIVFEAVLDEGRSFDVTKARVDFGASSVTLEGSYLFTPDPEMRVHLITSGLSLEDMGFQLKTGPRDLKAVVQGYANIVADPRHLGEAKIEGSLTAKDLSFSPEPPFPPIRDGTLSLAFTQDGCQISSFKALAGASLVEIQGTFEAWEPPKGRLRVTVDHWNLSDTFRQISSAPPSKKPPEKGWLDRSDLKAQVTLLKGHWKGMDLGPVEADCAFRSGDLFINPSKIKLEHGKIGFRAHWKRGEPSEWFVSSHIRLAKQPIRGLPEDLGFLKTRIDGLLSLETLFSGKGQDKKEFLSNLNGTASVLVEQGAIRESKVIFSVLEFLSLQDLFTKRPQDLSKEGIYFETIAGHMAVKKGITESDGFVMKSPVFNAVSQGTINLNTDTVDLGLGIEPWGTLDALVSRVPLVGYILTGEKKSLYVVYFKVTGPIGGPRVEHVPLKGMGDETLSFLKRLFLTPERIVQGIVAGLKQEIPEEEPPLPDEVSSPPRDMAR